MAPPRSPRDPGVDTLSTPYRRGRGRVVPEDLYSTFSTGTPSTPSSKSHRRLIHDEITGPGDWDDSSLDPPSRRPWGDPVTLPGLPSGDEGGTKGHRT